jgi:hypothetical protein
LHQTRPPRGKPPDTAATPPPRSRGMSPGVGTPQKTTRDKLLDKAIAWKLRVKRPPAYLLSMALDVLGADEKEDMIRDYEQDVLVSKDCLHKKLVSNDAACVRLGRARQTQTRRKQRLADGREVVEFCSRSRDRSPRQAATGDLEEVGRFGGADCALVDQSETHVLHSSTTGAFGS